MKTLLVVLLAAGALGSTAAAPAAETHAHVLFRQIRCLVCQNESIDDSGAPLAADLRALVRNDLAAGRSDADIKRALVDRYGEFVLLRPRFSVGNAALWLTPFLIVAAGLAAFAARGRKTSDEVEPALSEAERARVSALVATVTVPPLPRLTDTTPAV